MDQDSVKEWVRWLFEHTAPRYVGQIDPAFRPLVEGLVAFADLKPSERALDLGTGTGLAALAAAPELRHMTGLDYVRPLLVEALIKQKKLKADNIAFVQGDMHALCLPGQTFDVVMGSFSFNSTDPARVFQEARRVLIPGGRFVMQEWGSSDPASEVVYDTLAEYAVEDPPASLAAIREAFETPDAWDELESAEDIQSALEDAGFQDVRIQHEQGRVRFDDIDAFLRYKLAWASRHAELNAMPDDLRALFFAELQERMDPLASSDDTLIWEPELIRVRAAKPSP